MRYRARKRAAKRFLATGNINRRHIAKVDEYPVPGAWCTEIVLRSDKLRRAIRDEASRRGWSGCHWDDPLKTYDLAE